jgi:protein SCO1
MKPLLFALLILVLVIPQMGVLAQDGNDDDNEAWTPPINFTDGSEVNLTYTDGLMGTVVSPSREIADFTMPSTTGEDFTFSEQRGKIMMVYFGYMTCPDVCPTTMADMLRAYREVGEPKDNVSVALITIDPERDTMARLTSYVGAFHEDFIGLRPENQEQLDALLESFGIIAERREVDSALGYLIDHSASVLMIAPDGRLVAQFPYGVPYTEIANDLQVLIDYTLGSNTPRLFGDAASDVDPEREFRIVIPEGTGAQILMGTDPGIIPLKIYLTIGEQDILVLENHDDTDFLVGGIWVAPHETVRKQFYEPQTFVGMCTVTVGQDLVEIIVSEPSPYYP